MVRKIFNAQASPWVTLTDASTISVDAGVGNQLAVTLGGNRTLGNPSNPTDGQPITFRIEQDGTGGRTLAFSSKYSFPPGGAPPINSAIGAVTMISFIYNSADDVWNCLYPQAGTPGDIKMTAKSVLDPGYLWCDGSAISRTDYANLFSAIGTAYGSGDGSTTFNKPDLRGRFGLGLDNMGGSSANRVTSASTGGGNSTTLGGTGGEQVHTQTSGELAAHTHSTSGSGGVYNLTTGVTGVGLTSNSGGTSGSTGSSTPFNVMNNWQAVTYMIKY